MGFLPVFGAILVLAARATDDDTIASSQKIQLKDEDAVSFMQLDARVVSFSSGKISSQTLGNATLDVAAADVLDKLITVHRSLKALPAQRSIVNATTWWMLATVVTFILAFVSGVVGILLYPPKKRRKDALDAVAQQTVGQDHEQESAHAVIESLGFGLAQLQVLLLGDGIWFLEGWLVTIVNNAATSTALDFGLDDYPTALLSSVAMFGLMPGCLIGGILGDRFGRKPSILVAYFALALGSLGTSAAAGYTSLAIFRAVIGVACGLGMPTSTVMSSEQTPAKWRGAMIAGRGALYATGALAANLMCISFDPTLMHLPWRLLFVSTMSVSLVMLLFSSLFLHESALYLACTGQHAKAEQSFKHMRHWNARPQVSIKYAMSSESVSDTGEPTQNGSLWDHLCTIFTFSMLGCTVALIMSSVTGQMFGGVPRVLMDASSRHAMSASTQFTSDAAWGYLGCFALFVLDWHLTRKNMLIVIYGIFTIVLITFALTAQSHLESHLVSAMVQVSAIMLRVLVKVCSLTVQLASTECYPTALVATGSALIVGIGRSVGSSVGSLMYEYFRANLHLVTGFYCVCSAIALLNGLTIWRLLPAHMDTSRNISADHLFVRILANRAAHKFNAKLKS